MEIKDDNIKAAYAAADESGKKLLQALFPSLQLGYEDLPITDKVKTFNDACDILGGSANDMVRQYEIIADNAIEADGDDDILAYLKLRIITAALNEGWKPRFAYGEKRYHPEINLFDEDALSLEHAEWRLENDFEQSPIQKGTYVGCTREVSFDISFISSPISLCYKTKELAAYSGKQFSQLWNDYYGHR